MKNKSKEIGENTFSNLRRLLENAEKQEKEEREFMFFVIVGNEGHFVKSGSGAEMAGKIAQFLEDKEHSKLFELAMIIKGMK